jgi:phasin family protein
MLTLEQLVAAQRASLGCAFGAFGRAFEGFEKLVALNIEATRATLGEAQASARLALSSSNAPVAMQPNAERVSAYLRQTFDIVSATNADVAGMYAELFRQACQSLTTSHQTTTEDMTAPVDSATAFWKYAMNAANGGYGAMQQVLRQATAAAEAARSRAKSAH